MPHTRLSYRKEVRGAEAYVSLHLSIVLGKSLTLKNRYDCPCPLQINNYCHHHGHLCRYEVPSNSKWVMCVTSVDLRCSPQGRCYYFHFMNGKTEAQAG